MSVSVFGFGSWLEATLGGFGVKGQLALLFIIFFVDAVLFPMLPEAFVVLFYSRIPTIDTRFSDRADLFVTAATILLVVLAAELLANASLYYLVKWKGHRIPKKMSRAMNKWREFLVLSDERVVLLNRVVPIMPFTGAFIAVSPWNAKKAMGYLLLGGALKYGAIIGVVGAAGLVFDPRQTMWLSITLVVAILAISFASHGYLRRRLKQRLRALPHQIHDLPGHIKEGAQHLPHPHLPHLPGSKKEEPPAPLDEPR